MEDTSVNSVNPVRRLWSDQTAESKKAEELLESEGIQVIEVKFRSSNKHEAGPVLVTSLGVFKGIDRIQEYCKYWIGMENITHAIP